MERVRFQMSMERVKGKSFQRFKKVAILVGLIAAGEPSFHGGVVMNQNISDKQIDTAIRKLWSPSNVERENGIEQILRLGPSTIKSLISLLSELVQDSSPRFPTGKEKDGAESLELYIRSVQSSNGLDIDEEASNQIYNLAINARLISDAIYLLSEFKAEEAIPLLLHIMKNRYSHTYGDVGIEMIGLCRIGPASVPYLIEAIEESNKKDHDFDDIFLGYTIRVQLGGNEVESNSIPSENDDDERFEDEEIKERIIRVQSRAVYVLGETGDNRALPVLNKLLNTSKDRLLIDDIKEAIRKISKEPDSWNKSHQPQRRQIPFHEDYGKDEQ